MTTSTALLSNGFFTQLMPMLADRTLMLIVSKADDQHLTLSVVPKRMKEGENAALTTPLCCTGTPEELDRDLPAQLRDFVAGHVALSNNLAQIQCEREEAQKAAREELKKKQKTVGNGGSKVKPAEPQPKPEEKASPAMPAQSTMSLFDSATEPGGEANSRALVNPSVPGAANSQRRTGTTTTRRTMRRRAMKTAPMRREFSFQGLKLPDPNPQMSVEDIRGVLALQYPEIAAAAITGPEPAGDILNTPSNEQAVRRGNAMPRRMSTGKQDAHVQSSVIPRQSRDREAVLAELRLLAEGRHSSQQTVLERYRRCPQWKHASLVLARALSSRPGGLAR